VRALIAVDRRLMAPVALRRHQRSLVALALVIGARLATSSYERLADLPSALFEPPWFLAWLSGPPSTTALLLVQGAGLGGAVLTVATGGRRVTWFALCWAALLVLAGLESSAGKTLHNQVLLLLAAAPFLVPASPASPSSSGEPRIAGWHHRCGMVLASLGYLLAGMMKLRHSGLAWVTSDNLRWVLYAGARSPRSVAPEAARWIADRAWLSTGLAAGTLFAELSMPVAVVVRRLRVLAVVIVTGLHTAVFFLLGLDYWSWVAVMAVLFLPWQDALDRRQAARDRPLRWDRRTASPRQARSRAVTRPSPSSSPAPARVPPG
jgi:hypothetical protein